MATQLYRGPYKWDGGTDADGYRSYKVAYLVQSDDLRDGPQVVLDTAGLPRAGDVWSLGNDADLYAWCRYENECRKVKEEAGCPVWAVSFTFSTKPVDRCQNTDRRTDPLLEPFKVSGGASKYQREATFDRYGLALLTSSQEMIRGPQVEFDEVRGTVSLTNNVATFADVALAIALMNHLNADVLWGVPARCVKLSDVKFDLRYHGVCQPYYERKLEFEVFQNPDGTSGFDRDVLDEGSKILNGRWDLTTGTYVVVPINGQPPDPHNPTHYIRATDLRNNPVTMVLNGAGLPAGVSVSVNPVVAVAAVQPFVVGNLTLTANPVVITPPKRLAIFVTDADRSITGATVFISGRDANGVVVSEEIAVTALGTQQYVTANLYARVSVAALSDVVGAGAGDTIRIATPTAVMDPFYNHIEKYEEADFLLLGIPATL